MWCIDTRIRCGDHTRQELDTSRHIGDRVTATSALQVAMYQRVHIEDKVPFADHVAWVESYLLLVVVGWR